ncbi:MAG TPA: hypothetical protein VH186_08350 [Chloroflexia bacterium]|nr:hypothetical protein [Chloroflexia bacterium]
MLKLNLIEGEIRFWLDELPDVSIKPDHYLEYHFTPAKRAPSALERRLAVELIRHTGPVIRYGLLAATYNPSQSDMLDVVIPVVDRPSPVKAGEFSRSFDEIYAGLLAEY